MQKREQVKQQQQQQQQQSQISKDWSLLSDDDVDDFVFVGVEKNGRKRSDEPFRSPQQEYPPKSPQNVSSSHRPVAPPSYMPGFDAIQPSYTQSQQSSRSNSSQDDDDWRRKGKKGGGLNSEDEDNEEENDDKNEIIDFNEQNYTKSFNADNQCDETVNISLSSTISNNNELDNVDANDNNRLVKERKEIQRGRGRERERKNNPPSHPSLQFHNIGCAETCGLRPTMEDSVLLLPIGGWDLEKLIDNNEMGIVKRLLKYPAELRFNERGYQALEKREERIWEKNQAQKEAKKKIGSKNNSNSKNNINNDNKKNKNKKDDDQDKDGSNQSSSDFLLDETQDISVNQEEDQDSDLERMKEKKKKSRNDKMKEKEEKQKKLKEERKRKEEEELLKNNSNNKQKLNIPYRTDDIKGCGIYAVFDGHRGPQTANFLMAHFVDSFLISAIQRRKKYILEQKKRMISPKQNSVSPQNRQNAAQKIDGQISQQQQWDQQRGSLRPNKKESMLQEYKQGFNSGSLKRDPTASKQQQVTLPYQQQQQYPNKSKSPIPYQYPKKSTSPSPYPKSYIQMQMQNHLQLQRQRQGQSLNTLGAMSGINPVMNQQIQSMQQQIYQMQSQYQLIKDTIEHLLAKMFTLSVGDGACAIIAIVTPEQVPSQFMRFPIAPHNPLIYIAGKQLSIDHKPSNRKEMDYIRSVGGFVSLDKRLNGVLAVARTMGDFEYAPSISSDPDLVIQGINRWGGLHSGYSNPDQTEMWKREDICLVLACDGLYDVIDNQLLAEIACPWNEQGSESIFNDAVFSRSDSSQINNKGTMNKSLKNGKCMCRKIAKGQLAELAALRLRSAAEALDTTDNVSVVVIML
ncbi:MAG: hypothetical protein EZS28_018795 [Streblomastix strix]|uniref:protein-serine/threonine phosphatase n=1 Tax=Streblomastix strix TaxID=222440 RepID=A0A5J4VSW6_9EUKA|nr:MAG: hypothetical protein EZS28_018795 [Streblomastix strix]